MAKGWSNAARAAALATRRAHAHGRVKHVKGFKKLGTPAQRKEIAGLEREARSIARARKNALYNQGANSVRHFSLGSYSTDNLVKRMSLRRAAGLPSIAKIAHRIRTSRRK